MSCSAALLMRTFGDFLDDLGGEHLEITGIARGDDALVDNDGGIFPLASGIEDVGLDRFV